MLFAVFSLVLVSACKKKKSTENTTKSIELQTEKPKAALPEQEKIYPLTTAPKKPDAKKIVVKEGDWLYNISRREYGNSEGWIRIYNANKAQIKNPDLIFPNQELIIPN